MHFYPLSNTAPQGTASDVSPSPLDSQSAHDNSNRMQPTATADVVSAPTAFHPHQLFIASGRLLTNALRKKLKGKVVLPLNMAMHGQSQTLGIASQKRHSSTTSPASSNSSSSPKKFLGETTATARWIRGLLRSYRSDALNLRLKFGHTLMHGYIFSPNEKLSRPANFFTNLNISNFFKGERKNERSDGFAILSEVTINNGPYAARWTTTRGEVTAGDSQDAVKILFDPSNQYLVDDIKWHEEQGTYLIEADAFHYPNQDELKKRIRQETQSNRTALPGETPPLLHFPSAITEQFANIPNFRSHGRSFEMTLLGSEELRRPRQRLKRMTSLDELKLVLRQEALLMKTEGGREFMALLRRHFEGGALRDAETIRQLHEKIPMYSVDLAPEGESLELDRGFTMRKDFLGDILRVHMEGSEEDRLQMGYKIMHAYIKNNGSTFTGITSVSSRRHPAWKYCEQHLKDENYQSIGVFIKIRALGKNDEVDGAKGVTARVGLTFKTQIGKRNDGEIVMDPTNDYLFKNVKRLPTPIPRTPASSLDDVDVWVIEIDAFRKRGG